jgi:hypothetical protein
MLFLNIVPLIKELTLSLRFYENFYYGVCSLEIIGVEKDDEGVYTCKAENELGKAQTECLMSVEGKETKTQITNISNCEKLKCDGKEGPRESFASEVGIVGNSSCQCLHYEFIVNSLHPPCRGDSPQGVGRWRSWARPYLVQRMRMRRHEILM